MISFVVFSLRRAWQGFWRNARHEPRRHGHDGPDAPAAGRLLDHPDRACWPASTSPSRRSRSSPTSRTNVNDVRDRRRSSAELEAMPEVARGRRTSAEDEALARFRERLAPAGPARTSPATSTPTRSTPASRSSSSTRRPSRRRRRAALRAEPTSRRSGQGAAGRSSTSVADGHERPADGGHGHPRRDRGHRAVHHRQHDPPRRRRPRRGDRDHAARRRVGRVHPLAVRLRGRDRRAARRGARRSASCTSRPTRSAASWSASSRSCRSVRLARPATSSCSSSAPGSGLGDPRLLGLGPDLPHPLSRPRDVHVTVEPAGVASRAAGVRLTAPSPSSGDPYSSMLPPTQRPTRTAPSRARSRLRPRRRPSTPTPTSQPPTARPAPPVAPPAASILPIALVVVAMLAGGALFMSGLLARPADRRRSRARRRARPTPSSRSGTPTTRSRALRRRRRRPARR